MGIDIVTGHNDDMADFVEKTQRAMHAEVERGNALAEENVQLREKLDAAAEAHPGCGLLDDAASECQCAQREKYMRTKLEASERANAALREALEGLGLEQWHAVGDTNRARGETSVYALATALRALATDAGKDFVPRAEVDEARAALAKSEAEAAAMREVLERRVDWIDHHGDETAEGHGDDCEKCDWERVLDSTDAGKGFVPRAVAQQLADALEVVTNVDDHADAEPRAIVRSALAAWKDATK